MKKLIRIIILLICTIIYNLVCFDCYAENAIVVVYPSISNVVVPDMGTCFKHGDKLKIIFDVEDCEVLPTKISLGVTSEFEKNNTGYSGSGGVVFDLDEDNESYNKNTQKYDVVSEASMDYKKIDEKYRYEIEIEIINDNATNVKEIGFSNIYIYHKNWSGKSIYNNIDKKYIVNDNCANGIHSVLADDFEVIYDSNCHEEGLKKAYCIICGKLINEKIEINSKRHTGNIEVKGKIDATCISDGFSGDVYCTDCGELISNGETVKAMGHTPSRIVKENEVDPTCEEEGTYDEVVYCSECNKELSREEKTIPAKGHIYGITTYTWSEDGKSCTATSVCSNDSTHKITETATYEPDKADSQIKATVKEAATNEKMGTTTYTATFKNTEMFKVQTKDVVDIPKVEVTDNPSDTPSDKPTDKPSDNPSKQTDTTNPADTTKPSDTTKTDGNTSSNYNTKDSPVTPAPKEEGAKLPVTDTKAEYVVTSKAGEEPAVEYKPASDAADKTVSIPESVTVDGVTYAVNEIADNAFKGNKTVESVVIPKSVKEIGYSAFSGCTNLKSVTIPGSVTEIGDNAFTGCTNLKSVKIPESVTEIGDKAFSGCKKLNSVTIGRNVAEIGDSAFANCSALTKATLPANVTKLGSNIFKGCKKLKTITIKSKKLTAKTLAKNAFKGVGDKVTIKVPKGKKKAYTKLFRSKGLSKKVKIK